MTALEIELQGELEDARAILTQADFKINSLTNQLETAETNNKSLLNQISGLKNLLKRLQPICSSRKDDNADADKKAISEMGEVLDE